MTGSEHEQAGTVLRLLEERDRYKAALERIASAKPIFERGKTNNQRTVHLVKIMARDALKHATQTPEDSNGK